MKAFLKAIDDKAWSSVDNGWKTPILTDKDGDVTDLPQDQWTDDHQKEFMGNSKAVMSYSLLLMRTYSSLSPIVKLQKIHGIRSKNLK